MVRCYGIVGKVVLEGNCGTLMPMLKAGEITGVGRGTTRGYGGIRIKDRIQNPEFRMKNAGSGPF